MIKINGVIQGDCLEVMKKIDDQSIDMILCDLPYGINEFKWDKIIPFELLWEQYKRIIKDKGAIVLTARQSFSSKLVASNLDMFKYEWIWIKNTGMGFSCSHDRPIVKHEQILVFSKGDATPGCNLRMNYNPQGLIEINKKMGSSKAVPKKINRYGDRYNWHKTHLNKERVQKFTNYPNDLLSFPSESKLFHPTQKPVKLFEYLIKTYTNEGDLVLDNCAGSGTTGVACKNTNRNFILIEKEEKYCKIAEQRLKGEIVKEGKEEKSKGGFFK
jgi:site-specific DNA-methyltransferase (adenine-specific)